MDDLEREVYRILNNDEMYERLVEVYAEHVGTYHDRDLIRQDIEDLLSPYMSKVYVETMKIMKK